MANFTVTIVERPAIKTAGLKVRTTMDKTGVDCPKLWSDDFAPRMGTFPCDASRPGESYGLCIMVDNDTIDYWAVMPIAAGAAVPEGMDSHHPRRHVRGVPDRLSGADGRSVYPSLFRLARQSGKVRRQHAGHVP